MAYDSANVGDSFYSAFDGAKKIVDDLNKKNTDTSTPVASNIKETKAASDTSQSSDKKSVGESFTSAYNGAKSIMSAFGGGSSGSGGGSTSSASSGGGGFDFSSSKKIKENKTKINHDSTLERLKAGLSLAKPKVNSTTMD